MSKEIKEKCKECVYYNDKMEYPVVNGTTTHSNCMSIKCEYRKETKDMKIERLTSKITELEAKLAESEEKYDKLFECYKNTSREDLDDKYRLAEENEQLKQQLVEKETRIAELEDKDWYEGTIKQLEEQNGRLIKQLAKSVVFPKLEKDYGHKGCWYLYELDYKGDICCTSFEATKEEAEQELYNLLHQHEDKGE